MIKFTDCQATGCEVGFLFCGGVEADLVRTYAEACKTGFLQIGNEQEFKLLLERMSLRPESLERLASAYNDAKPEHKEEVIQKSPLFEYLSAFANVATVYAFLEGVVKSMTGS